MSGTRHRRARTSALALMLAVAPEAVRVPGHATLEMGRRGVELFIDRTVAQIREFRGE